MNILFDNEKKSTWQINGVDCGGGVDCMRMRFSTVNARVCIKAEVYANGIPVGCGMLANTRDDDDIYFEIEKLSGVTDICILTNEPAQIYEVELCLGRDIPSVAESRPMFFNTAPTLWEATDMLGRRVVSAEEAGERRPEKKVGLFYWTWRDAHKMRRPVNLTKFLAEYPDAEFDFEHPAWGDSNLKSHWNEPGMGFYLSSDPYVLRKHAVMLADAEIDFLVFDCTNADFLWKDGYEPLLFEFARARADGIRTPEIAFMLNFGPTHDSEEMLRTLYQDLYRPGKYKDLWFMLDGKPLIMAYPEALPEKGICPKDTEILNEIREFFTFRPGQPLYAGGPQRPDQWGWLEMTPQNKYCVREDGSCEMMTVGVAQNAREGRICTYFNDENTFGRSYTYGDGHNKLDSESYKYGYNFQEQWDYAIQADPDIIFITGWNEWQVGQGRRPWILDPDSKQVAFVDQYDRERSRDIEPDIDGYLDTYYLQMISNIRKFKGADKRVRPSGETSIEIFGDVSQWKDVQPRYINTRGAVNRDCEGYRGCYYKNNSARNEIIISQVTRDAENLYFYVECADKLSTISDKNWMTLFIDTDRDKKTGWEGYDVVINRLAPHGRKASVEMNVGGFAWESIGEADIYIGEKHVVLKVSRKLLGLNDALDFEFKWSDNMQSADVMDFYYNGDCAPHGRFNYLYKE